jgi:hypothetical protein
VRAFDRHYTIGAAQVSYKDSLLEGCNTKISPHGVRYPPRQHLEGGPVRHGDQIQKAPPHRNRSDVRASNLVRSINRQIAQEVGVYDVFRMRRAGARLLIHRRQPHPTHQPPHPVTADTLTVPPQVPHHSRRAVKRRLQDLLVYQPHQQSEFTLPTRHVVESGPADRKQLALRNNRQMFVIRSNQIAPPCHAHRPEAFAKNPVP